MKRIRLWLPQALFESFIMIVSIVAALAVNEWRTEFRYRAHALRL
jgi:hypothetical protein